MSQHKMGGAAGDPHGAPPAARRQTGKYAALVDGMNALLAAVHTAGATRAGEVAPAFRFRDGEGKSVSLRGQPHQRPLVIVFHRGTWCDYCAAGLDAIEKALPELCAFATVLAISPQLPAQDGRAQLISLSDPHNVIAAKFGLRYTVPAHLVALYRDLGVDGPGFDGDGDWTLPMSALYVVGDEGLVLYSELHADYTSQPGPDNALSVLRANQRRLSTVT